MLSTPCVNSLLFFLYSIHIFRAQRYTILFLYSFFCFILFFYSLQVHFFFLFIYSFESTKVSLCCSCFDLRAFLIAMYFIFHIVLASLNLHVLLWKCRKKKVSGNHFCEMRNEGNERKKRVQ